MSIVEAARLKQLMGSDDAVDLVACGLAPSVLAGLLAAGFRYKGDVVGLTARELANECSISAIDASGVLDVLQRPRAAPGPADRIVTAFDLFEEEKQLTVISTLLPELDRILGGGFARCEVTELCGAPGSGKTQLSLHACIAAQGQFATASGRSAVYIDTEGGFVVDRVAVMAESFIQSRPDLASRGLNRDELLKGIVYFRAHDFVEQVEVMKALPELLHAQPEIQLVVVDSIAFHFRHGFEDFSQRSRALDTISSMLHRIAVDHKIAVITTNQTTTRSGGVHSDTPALGVSWSHSVNNRLMLAWENEVRVARVTKSPLFSNDQARFQGGDAVGRYQHIRKVILTTRVIGTVTERGIESEREQM